MAHPIPGRPDLGRNLVDGDPDLIAQQHLQMLEEQKQANKSKWLAEDKEWEAERENVRRSEFSEVKQKANALRETFYKLFDDRGFPESTFSNAKVLPKVSYAISTIVRRQSRMLQCRN